jgi:hypothetical protein
MFEIRLVPTTRTDGSLELRLSLGFRLMFTVFAVVVAVGMLSTPRIALLPSTLLLILLFGALYDERWRFDPASKTIVARHGLLIAGRKRSWRFDEIAAVHSSYYMSGTVPGSGSAHPDRTGSGMRGRRFFQRPHIKYGLTLTSGEMIRIEIRRVRDTEDRQEIPTRIARMVGVEVDHLDV